MVGFMLLLGHLLGDYILQNDWMALNKTRSSWHCLVHCLAYTFSVYMCCMLFMPLVDCWPAYLFVVVTHFLIDRPRLTYHWMVHVSGQRQFATGPLSPWSIIVVDNTMHLIILALAATWSNAWKFTAT